MEKQPTRKEILLEIVKLMDGQDINVSKEQIKDFAKRQIASLEKKAQTEKTKAKEKLEEGDELRNRIQAVLTDEYQTISAISAYFIGEEDVTVGKIRSRLGQLVKVGLAEKTDVKVDKGTVKGYKRV